MTKKKNRKSRKEELWQELKERDEYKNLTSTDLVQLIMESSGSLQKEFFKELAKFVFNKHGVTQSRLFILMKYALNKEIKWLIKGSWKLLKKSYPTVETLIFIIKYAHKEKTKKEAWDLLKKEELTDRELEELESVVMISSEIARIKDDRRNIIEELKR